MANEFEKALDAEIAGLEAALKADARFLKLEEAKRLRALYAGAPVIERPTRQISSSNTRSTPRSPANQAILDCAAEMLSGRAIPTSTSDVYDHVSAKMTIPGTIPKNNLAAMLSNSPRFQSNGRKGWTLAGDMNEASDTLFNATSEAPNPIAATLAVEPNVKPVDPALGGGA
jgi:hypothetical protein